MNRLMIPLLWLLSCLPAEAATRAELASQVDALTERVQHLERQLEQVLAHLDVTAQAETAVAEALHEETAASSSEAPTFSIGGRVRLDIVGNSVSVGGAGGANRPDVAFTPGAIPLDDTGEDNQVSGNARDSRIWVNATTPTRHGDLGAYIELDFGSFDNSGNERVSNSHNPRIRHAYATYRNFTMGQTTSTFQNMSAFPEINDANGPVGVLNTRQPLIRYTRDEGRWQWSVAAEQPETTITASDGRRLSFDDDQFPDLVGRVDFQHTRGEISLAGVIRQIRVDDIIEDETTGVGLSLSGRWFLPNSDNLRFAIAHGEGIGRYVSYNSFNDALIDAGELETIPVQSAFVAYQHWWNRRWRSNLALGYAEADLDAGDYTTGMVNEQYLSSHLNLLWSPVPNATFGIEWLYGRRELLNGMTGRLNRLQFTSLYKFRN